MRNLKVLGLAFIAMLAFSALAATAASADDFTAEKYPATGTGINESLTADQFVTTVGTVRCARSTYHATLSAPTTAVTVTADYSDPHPEPGKHNCTTNGIPSVIDVNECHYIFNIGAGTTGDVDLECPAGKEVTVTVTPTGAVSPCTVHIASQTDIGGTATYSNIGIGSTREITVNVELSGIDYKHTKGSGLAACPEGSATNGTLKATATITGENDPNPFKEHIGLFLS